MCLAIPACVEQLIANEHGKNAVPDNGNDFRSQIRHARPPHLNPLPLAGEEASESLHESRFYDSAIVSLGGVRKEVSLALVEDIAVGDYVIVHVGFALQKLDQAEAERTLEMFAQLSAMNDLPDESY